MFGIPEAAWAFAEAIQAKSFNKQISLEYAKYKLESQSCENVVGSKLPPRVAYNSIHRCN